MGLGDFWGTGNRADEFLRTGKTENVKDLLRSPGTSFRIVNSEGQWVAGDGVIDTGVDLRPPVQGCVASEECPSGYSCINGQCTRMGPGGDQQLPSPGDATGCDPLDPESPCNSGAPGSCQQAPTCGDDSEAKDCCGERCCTFGSASSTRPGVHCFCGPCPPWPTCNSFCEAYLSAIGNPGPGCTEGPDGNSCDKCNVCDLGECVPDPDAPCFCDAAACASSGECLGCDIDPESFDFGVCGYVGDLRCQNCATITNYLCPCGIVLPPVTACKGKEEDGILAINLAQAEAAKQCDDLCPKDRCRLKKNVVKNCCFADYGDCTYPICTPLQKEIGRIQDENGYGCVICENPSTLPDNCGLVQCNCHGDCPDCYECGPTGMCELDERCECEMFEVTVEFTKEGFGYVDCAGNTINVPTTIQNETWDQRGTQIRVECIPAIWEPAEGGGFTASAPAEYRIYSTKCKDYPESLRITYLDELPVGNCFQAPYDTCGRMRSRVSKKTVK